jgi:hypothetical protein
VGDHLLGRLLGVGHHFLRALAHREHEGGQHRGVVEQPESGDPVRYRVERGDQVEERPDAQQTGPARDRRMRGVAVGLAGQGHDPAVGDPLQLGRQPRGEPGVRIRALRLLEEALRDRELLLRLDCGHGAPPGAPARPARARQGRVGPSRVPIGRPERELVTAHTPRRRGGRDPPGGTARAPAGSLSLA